MSLFNNCTNESLEKLKAQFPEEKTTVLKPGMVIRKYDKEAKKEKWIIILGVDEGYVMTGAVRVNSVLNTKVFRDKEMLDLQYPLDKKDNEFLSWNSTVDCSNLVERDYAAVINHISDNPDEYKGDISGDDLRLITETVVESPTITPRKLKQFNLIDK